MKTLTGLLLILISVFLLSCGSSSDAEDYYLNNSDISGCKELGTYSLDGLTIVNHDDWNEMHDLFLYYGGVDREGETLQGFYFNNEAHIWTGSPFYLEVYGHECCHHGLHISVSTGVITGPVAFY